MFRKLSTKLSTNVINASTQRFFTKSTTKPSNAKLINLNTFTNEQAQYLPQFQLRLGENRGNSLLAIKKLFDHPEHPSNYKLRIFPHPKVVDVVSHDREFDHRDDEEFIKKNHYFVTPNL